LVDRRQADVKWHKGASAWKSAWTGEAGIAHSVLVTNGGQTARTITTTMGRRVGSDDCERWL
jgi:hypothetical protein